MVDVLVTGFFDMLHDGHIEFFKKASKYGDLYVNIGNDENLLQQKHRLPVYTQEQRLEIIRALGYVKSAWISKEVGYLDFKEGIKEWSPDMFIINEEGHSEQKKKACKDCGIKYKVLKRTNPRGNVSTTDLMKRQYMPYRLCLAGAGLDQPYLNKFGAGFNLTVSIEPTHEFMKRGGMATSTRDKALELWGSLPKGDEQQNSKVLFSYENPPGTKNIAGYQDAVGICSRGIRTCIYNDGYIPVSQYSVSDEDTYTWLENLLYLIPLKPRKKDYDLFKGARYQKRFVEEIAMGADMVHWAIQEKNAETLGIGMTVSYQGYTKVFPETLPPYVRKIIKKYQDDILGWKLTGAGGGGYILAVSKIPIKGALRVKIRR